MAKRYTKLILLRQMQTRTDTAYENKEKTGRGRRPVPPITLPAMPWDTKNDQAKVEPDEGA
jgi:hypothetical protein